MTSDLITDLTVLIDRWETLSNAAAQQVESAGQPVQGGFYAGVLFGMGVARDELVEALANAMAEVAKPSTGMMYSDKQPPN
ncbi:MAG: hypothetical protein ABI970_14905 [Chloroflexota bacterium]|nr:hypothetical protein [Anaerolineae bacterium]